MEPTSPPAPSAPPDATTADFDDEVARGQRFEFGRNWRRFLDAVDDERIAEAEASLRDKLGVDELEGKTFLDAGSGSGLFSLAASNLGARVRSFDYDPASVACTQELRRRHAPDADWTIERGDVLDPDYLASLGTFDVVYSWGVLHHTGAMWDALGNVSDLVVPGGRLFIAIYNDQGGASRRWTRVKRAYNRAPRPLKPLVLYPAFLRLWVPNLVGDVLHRRGPGHSWRTYKRNRGMTPWVDVVDWVGGYPFEVAKPEQVFDFYRARGFELTHLGTHAGGIGCNEFVFQKAD